MSKSGVKLNKLFPFLNWLAIVNRPTLRDDLIAGLTNAIVVLPQGVAFSMIAGLPPEYGLYTAIIPPIVAGLFGSSMHLISGPTTALSIVVFSTISPYAQAGTPEFVKLTLTLTFLAGVFQLALGLARMGVLVNFISHSVVVGFTAGASILIAASQLKHCLGVSIPQGASFITTLIELVKAIPQTNHFALIISVSTLLIVVILRKIDKRIPGMLIGMVAGSLIAIFIGAEPNGVKLVGPLPSNLPPLSLPDFSPDTIRLLSAGALAAAMLGLIEAVSISRSIATKSRQRIDGNQEFAGQGLSNIVGSFFSCYVSSGSFTRSGLNYTSGAKTPLSAVFAAIILAVIIFFVAPLAAYLPIPAMGGIVLIVAYNLIDFHHIKTIFKASKGETAVLVTTFLSTLLVELEFAIYVGVMLSLILYLNRTSQPRILTRAPNPKTPRRAFGADPDLFECPQLKIIRVDGSLFFGAVNHFEDTLSRMTTEDPEQKNILIVCSGMNFIDVAGAETIAHEAEKRKTSGGCLYLYGMKLGVCNIIRGGGYNEVIGEENIFNSKEEAIREIVKRMDSARCQVCNERIFLECANRPYDKAKADEYDRTGAWKCDIAEKSSSEVK